MFFRIGKIGKMDFAVFLLKKLIALRPVSANIPACNQVADRLRLFLDEHGLRTEMEEINGRHILYVSTLPGWKNIT